MKTGGGIENPQFTTEERLPPVIAVLSVVTRLRLNLRDASRDPAAKVCPAQPCIPVAYIKVLSGWRYEAPRTGLTVHEFYDALARLGGHQNRRHDHPPGWLVLWRGWTKLEAMDEGARAVGALSMWVNSRPTVQVTPCAPPGGTTEQSGTGVPRPNPRVIIP